MFLSLGLCGTPAQSKPLSEVVARHATAAWVHINMLGEYDFSDEKLRDTIGNLPLKSGA